MDNILLEEIRDNQAFLQLNSLLKDMPYIPFTDSSLSFTSLAVVLNDLSINQRKCIVEFGPGTSTIVMARFLQTVNRKDAKYIAVEHDEEWCRFLQQELDSRDLGAYVQLVCAPLTAGSHTPEPGTWYNEDIVAGHLKQLEKVDCVLIDGPPAWELPLHHARYPAVPFLKDYLSDQCAIFLDDTHRPGEKVIIEKWHEILYGFNREPFSESFTGWFRGAYFNVRLPKAKLP